MEVELEGELVSLAPPGVATDFSRSFWDFSGVSGPFSLFFCPLGV